MADQPEDSEATIPGGEKPKPEEAGAPPEVDAEIVEDGYRQPEPDTPSAKTEAEQTTAGAPSPEDRRAAASSAPRGPFGLSPGVMLLIVLVAVLVVGFAIWRLAGRGAPASTLEESADSATVAAPPTLPEPDPNPPERTGETSAPSEPAPASIRPAPDRSKIANTGAAAAKEEATAIDPAASLETSRGLPPAPAPAAGGNEALQNAAKNAAKALSGVDSGDAIDLGDTEAPAGGQEIEAPAPDVEAPPSHSADPAPSETPDATLSDQEASLPGAEKIANELAEMKAALAAAQTLNARQADEIAAMRDSFQQALVERDRAAGAAIASLSARLDKIQTDAATPRGREAAASLALAALQRVIDSGSPYKPELDALSGLVSGRPELETLRARAESGAPTLLALKKDFPAAARAALAAANRATSKGPFSDFFARLETLISIRPAAPIAGGGAAAIVSRAEDRLDKDMLAAAVTELEALPAPSSEAFGQWLADARARLAADQAITDLNAALLADFVE